MGRAPAASAAVAAFCFVDFDLDDLVADAAFFVRPPRVAVWCSVGASNSIALVVSGLLVSEDISESVRVGAAGAAIGAGRAGAGAGAGTGAGAATGTGTGAAVVAVIAAAAFVIAVVKSRPNSSPGDGIGRTGETVAGVTGRVEDGGAGVDTAVSVAGGAPCSGVGAVIVISICCAETGAAAGTGAGETVIALGARSRFAFGVSVNCCGAGN